MADPIVQTFSSGGDADEALLGYKATIPAISPNSQTQRRNEPDNANQVNSTGDGSDRSDVGVNREEFEALQKRFNDAQQHIGKLEGENAAFRNIVDKYPNTQGGDPKPDQAKISDPLDDPEFVQRYKSTFGEDEITAEANYEMLKRMRDSLKSEYSQQLQGVQQNYQQQMYYDQVKTSMWRGMQDAIQTYGDKASELVNEFINSNGSYGSLSQAIQANPRVVESADLVSSLIGSLVWKSGGANPPQPQSQPQNNNPNPASRPTRSQSVSNDGDELSREEQIARNIVAAKSPSQALPFMR